MLNTLRTASGSWKIGLIENSTSATQARKTMRLRRVPMGEESTTVTDEASMVTGNRPIAPISILSTVGLSKRWVSNTRIIKKRKMGMRNMPVASIKPRL